MIGSFGSSASCVDSMKNIIVRTIIAGCVCIVLFTLLIPYAKKTDIENFSPEMRKEVNRHLLQSNYNVTLSPDNHCTNQTNWVILIITSPANSKQRQLLRETILTPLLNDALPGVKYFFLVGQSSNSLVNQLIEREHLQRSDIIQGTFEDSYEDLAIKSLFALKWTSEYCSEAKFLLKMDDDVFANINALDAYLNSLEVDKNLIAGTVWTDAVPVYNMKSKWHIDPYYKKPHFPTYTSGAAYIISSDLLQPLFHVAMTTPVLRLEDVFVTGECAAKLVPKVKHIKVDNMVTWKRKELDPNKILTIHGYNADEFRTLWSKVH